MSFDTPSTKLSSDPSGQHLDIGTWSFGGAFTLSTWIKADDWRNKYSVLHLPGSAAIELRSPGVFSRELYLQMDGTSGGTENISSGAGLLEWGKWIHLGIALQNGGTNNSTGFVYKNGSLFATVTGMSLPNIVSRSPQYIGRSNTSSHAYFAGDLDDFRLYSSTLSASDIAAIYNEASAGIHYQAQALNNPLLFCNGLPTGLSINPTTGAITGHTTQWVTIISH